MPTSSDRNRPEHFVNSLIIGEYGALHANFISPIARNAGLAARSARDMIGSAIWT
jgi:hypothetical protein